MNRRLTNIAGEVEDKVNERVEERIKEYRSFVIATIKDFESKDGGSQYHTALGMAVDAFKKAKESGDNITTLANMVSALSSKVSTRDRLIESSKRELKIFIDQKIREERSGIDLDIDERIKRIWRFLRDDPADEGWESTIGIDMRNKPVRGKMYQWGDNQIQVNDNYKDNIEFKSIKDAAEYIKRRNE